MTINYLRVNNMSKILSMVLFTGYFFFKSNPKHTMWTYMFAATSA